MVEGWKKRAKRTSKRASLENTEFYIAALGRSVAAEQQSRWMRRKNVNIYAKVGGENAFVDENEIFAIG